MSDAGGLIVSDAPRDAAGRVNLLGMSRAALQDFLVGLGEKPYRALQLMKWIYHQGVSDFSAMTDVGRDLRERLAGQR
jgi:23S rRNA (adenine2503-C2)-methyltransferase